MQAFYDIYLWLISFFVYGSEAVQWLITPLHIGTLSITPLGLLSISGICAFIPVAIVKWVAS